MLIRHAFVWNKLVYGDLQVMRTYVQCYHDYYEYDQFDSSFELLPSMDINMYTVSNDESIYKSWNIFKGGIWPIRFHSKFTSKMVSYQANQIKYVLSFIWLLAQGIFIGRNSLQGS